MKDPERLFRPLHQILKRELVDRGRRVREVGVDLEAIEIADDKQRRVFEGLSILQELPVRGREILALALILPGEVALLPHVSEAVAAAGLLGALLKGVPVACG